MADRRLLGELLIEAGLVRRADVDMALEEQRVRGGRLCYHLMRLGKVTPAALFLFLQDHFGVIAPHLLETLRSSPAVDVIPARLAHFYQMVPLIREGNKLLLALAYVDNPNLIPAVEEMTGLKVEPIICPPGMLRDSLARFFQTEEEAGVIRSALEENVLVLSDPSREIAPGAPESLADDASGVVWLRALIGEAVRRRCREILLEPLDGESRVTFRQRGGGPGVARDLAPGPSGPVGVARRIFRKWRPGGEPFPGRLDSSCALRSDISRCWSPGFPGCHGDAYHLRMVEERIRKTGFEEMLEDYPEARSALEIALATRKGVLLVAAPDGHYRERIITAFVQWIRWEAGQTILLGGPRSVRLPGIDLRVVEDAETAPLPDAIRAAVHDRPDLLAVLQVQTQSEVSALMAAGRRSSGGGGRPETGRAGRVSVADPDRHVPGDPGREASRNPRNEDGGADLRALPEALRPARGISEPGSPRRGRGPVFREHRLPSLPGRGRPGA